MRSKKKDPTRSLDAAWTWIGSTVFGASVAIWFYLRSGGTSIFPDPKAQMQDDAVVTVAYWGMLISSAGLGTLGLLALRYNTKGYGDDMYLWPRYTVFEGDVRDSLVSRATFIVLTLLPLSAWVASTIAYLKSEIALWNQPVPLADGFFGSRWAAVLTPCNDQPCFRMHPLDGSPPYAIQWFTGFNDLGALALILFTVAVWCKWWLVRRPA